MALFLQRGQREGDVMRSQLRAVMEPRLGTHREAIGQLVRRDLHRFRGEAVHRVRLVIGARHQRREGQVHALRALALQNVGVERIEGEKGLVVGAHRRDDRKQPALRRVDIDVVEMVEVGGIFQVAERRDAVSLGAASAAAAAASCSGAQRRRAPSASTCRRESSAMRMLPSRALADPRRLFSVVPPQRRKPGEAIFRQRLGMAEAIPAGIAREAVGELRHDVEIPQQHAVERLGRGDQLVPVLGEDDLLDQGIDRGILDAAVLREPGMSAACEPQNSRCSLPGDSDCPQRSSTMSKSKLRSRF